MALTIRNLMTTPPPARARETCATCKHWHQHEDTDSHGECCAILSNNVSDRELGKVIKAWPAHVSGLHAGFWTRAEFGCALWNPRDPDQQGGDMPEGLLRR